MSEQASREELIGHIEQAIVVVTGSLIEAIRIADAIGYDPDEDQAVQFFQSHIATWRLALKHDPATVIADYVAHVARVRSEQALEF